jgi:hypothetical protein
MLVTSSSDSSVLDTENGDVYIYIHVKPDVTYGAETWTITKKEKQALFIFEREIFRRIYGPKYEDGEWNSRTNR